MRFFSIIRMVRNKVMRVMDPLGYAKRVGVNMNGQVINNKWTCTTWKAAGCSSFLGCSTVAPDGMEQVDKDYKICKLLI